MLCPKHALVYAVLLAVLLDPVSGRKRYHRQRFKSGQHTYPPTRGLSETEAYSQDKLDEKTYENYYQYNPPQSLTYSSSLGRTPVHYPVYRGSPPNYIYKYKNSGSKFGTLLTGLALLNLGALGAAAYSHIKQNSNSRRTPQPDDVCKFEVKKDNGDYEETQIDCQFISSFILQEQRKQKARVTMINTTFVDTTNNEAMLDLSLMRTSEPEPTVVVEVLYKMLRNGTLVPINVQRYRVSTESEGTSVLITVTLNNALDVKGEDVEVTPGMECFVSRTSSIHNMRKSVPCGLLQTYAESSVKLVKPVSASNGNVRSIGTSRYDMSIILTAVAVLKPFWSPPITIYC
ncbi:hypothetical protein PYW07_003733 [Mythimna separata]|uniref:Uncharacterized protein n=1 Tax=Mythimna separata TaxID=271217 RepID=A0AAD7YP27_MYTSE|nr:hypothetical protein PYW07_003733 [Mythimna separata]